MNYSNKIVTSIPLENIWVPEHQIEAQRVSYLTRDKLKHLLQSSPVNFIIANVGEKLKWIEESQCFNFWKVEVEIHLVTDINKINLDDYSDNYAYIASEWRVDNQIPIILLEKKH